MQSLAEKDAAIVPGTSGYEGSITAKAKDRLQAAIGLYEAGLVRQIIVSGDEKEIKPMTRYLMKKGIPSESLSSDPQGVDTYDTIARVKEKFGGQKDFNGNAVQVNVTFGNKAGDMDAFK